MNTDNKNLLDYQPKPENEIKLEIKKYQIKHALFFSIFTILGLSAAFNLPTDISLILIPALLILDIIIALRILKKFKKNIEIDQYPNSNLIEKINGTQALIIKELFCQDPHLQQKVSEIIKFRGKKLLNIDFYAITKGYDILKLTQQIDMNVADRVTHQIIEDTSPCTHISTTMFHEGLAQCFKCNATINSKREIVEPLNKDHKTN